MSFYSRRAGMTGAVQLIAKDDQPRNADGTFASSDGGESVSGHTNIKIEGRHATADHEVHGKVKYSFDQKTGMTTVRSKPFGTIKVLGSIAEAMHELHQQK